MEFRDSKSSRGSFGVCEASKKAVRGANVDTESPRAFQRRRKYQIRGIRRDFVLCNSL